MNDLNRNTRTLIVSFVIAIMFLVPLRFVEVGQGLNLVADNPQVLGEVSEMVKPEINGTAKLEAPYDTLESQNCINKTELNKLEVKTLEKIKENKLSVTEKSDLLDNLKLEELRACK